MALKPILAMRRPCPSLLMAGSHPLFRIAAIVTLAVAAGCSSKSATPFRPVAHKTAPVDPWVLTCLDPTEPNPALLWNGQIGIRIGRDGTGSGPMFLIDEYDTKAEEKIRELQNVLEGTWTAGPDSVPLSPRGTADYKQTLDIRSGLLTTTWSQMVAGVMLQVDSVVAVEPNRREIAQDWTITSNSYIDVRFQARGSRLNETESRFGPREFQWLWPPSDTQINERDEVGPDNRRHDPRAKEVSDWGPGFINNAADKGRVLTFGRVLGVAPSPSQAKMVLSREAEANTVASSDDTFPDVQESHWAYKDLAHGHPPTIDELMDQVKAGWAKRWKSDIEIDGPVEDQQAVRSFLFYLRSAIDPNGKMSISPFGLSNTQYNGHVFWDADIWVFPALALIEPEEARAIANYRLETREGAIDNEINFRTPIKPHITEYEPYLLKRDFPKYAWESSVTGRETIFGPSTNEEHINGDVPWMLGQAAALGLIQAQSFDQAVKGAAKYWMERSSALEDAINPELRSFKPLPGGENRVIERVMSPDESHIGDNDLYTNLLAQWCVNGGNWERRVPPGDTGGMPVKTHGRDAHATFKLPRDKISFLTYDDDPVRSYKQAAAVLSIYPLQYPPAENEAKVMMDRFADKVIKNGPAMSDSVHALIWARLGETDKAYETWEKSWKDFVKEPFLQFSEKRNKTSTYFTTGAAGCLQTVLYGFLGFRIDSKKQDGAQWSTPLALGKILSVRPNLPKQWNSVKLKNFIVDGRRYTLTATHKGVTVTQGDR